MFLNIKKYHSFSYIDSFKVCEKEKRRFDLLGNTVVEEYDARYDEYDSDGNKLIYSFSLETFLNRHKKKNKHIFNIFGLSLEPIVDKSNIDSIFRKDALSFIENFFEYKYIQNPDYIIFFNEKFLSNALSLINFQYCLKQQNEEWTILRFRNRFYKSNQELLYPYEKLDFKNGHEEIIDDLVCCGEIIPLAFFRSEDSILKYFDISKESNKLICFNSINSLCDLYFYEKSYEYKNKEALDSYTNICSLKKYYNKLIPEKMFYPNITKQSITFRKAFIDLLKWHISEERDQYCFFTNYSYNCYCDDCCKYLGLPKEKQLYFEEKSKYMSDFLSIPSDLIFQMSQKIKEYTESIKSKILANKFLRYIHPYGSIYEEGIAYEIDTIFFDMNDISFCKSLEEIADHTKESIDMWLSLEDGMNELMSNADPRIRNFYNYLNENCVENQNKFKSGYQIMKEMSDWLGELLENK